MTRDFLYLSISLFTWGLGDGAFFYYQPLFLEDLGASPVLIGAILGGAGVAMTVVHIPAGYLADRFGRRKLIWAGWFTGIVTTGIMAAAKTLPFFSLGLILYAATLFVIAPLNSYVTSARGKLSVEQALTTSAAAFNLGAVIGPLIGGIIADRSGLRSIFIFSFVVLILSGFVILLIKPQTLEENPGSQARDLLRNRNFLFFLPLIFLVFFALFFPLSLAPNFLRNQRDISLQTIGVLGSISSLGTAILNLLFGFLPVQIGLILGQIFGGVFTVLVWQTTQMPWLVTAYFLLGGFNATRSVFRAQVEKLVNKANLGLAYGITESVAGLASTAAPPLAGILYARNPTLIFSTGLLLLIPPLLFTVTRRKLIWKP